MVPAPAAHPPGPPGGAGPGRPVPPPPMINAVRLMYVGSALAAVGVIAAIITAGALTSGIRPQYAAASGGIGAAAAGALVVTVAGGLISIGVWLAMARRTRRGRPGVRVLSMIFFILHSLTVASTYSRGLLTHATWIAGLAEWGAGLAIIVLLWDRRSSAYFAGLRQARQLATPQWRPPEHGRAAGPGTPGRAG